MRWFFSFAVSLNIPLHSSCPLDSFQPEFKDVQSSEHMVEHDVDVHRDWMSTRSSTTTYFSLLSNIHVPVPLQTPENSGHRRERGRAASPKRAETEESKSQNSVWCWHGIYLGSSTRRHMQTSTLLFLEEKLNGDWKVRKGLVETRRLPSKFSSFST